MIDALAADLLGAVVAAQDGVPRAVILWLDHEGQFARLIPPLAIRLERDGVALLRPSDEPDSESQWPLKLALLRLDAAIAVTDAPTPRAVVYLSGYGRHDLDPGEDGAPPRLWSCYEYRYKGALWGRVVASPGVVPEPHDLLSWLRTQGLTVADTSVGRTLTAGGGDSLLARYAEQHRDSAPRDWPRPLRLADVRDDLAGDPRDTLRGLLAAPTPTVAAWGDNRALVLDRLVAEYGLTAPAPDAVPEDLADAFALQMALAEAWEAFGRPTDFPFLSVLPKRVELRTRLAAFLRDDIITHTDLGPRFRTRLARLEPKYTLSDWARGRTGQPVGLPLLARTRWTRFLANFDAASADDNWKAARDLLAERRADIATGTTSQWDGREDESAWGLVADLATLCDEGARAVEESAQRTTATDLVAAYAARWWRVDRLHLRLRTACYARSVLARIRRVADLAYFDYVQRVNERFSAAVEHGSSWPPAGTESVPTLRDRVWRDGGGRRGVIVCDSLRWDLAQGVVEQLTAHGDADTSTRPVLSTLPSQTQFGMTAMLPLGPAPIVLKYDGEIGLRDPAGRNLATRDGRKAFLDNTLTAGTGSLGGGRGGVGFLDMENLLKGAAVPKGRTIVIYDNNIDEQGHKGTEELPLLARELVGNICRTVGALHDAGIGTVHILTDHGFLFLAPDLVDGLGRPEVDVKQASQRTARWAALKPDSPVADVFTLPSPWPGDPTTLGFPRGVRTLVKAEEYEHGGISLQECVIPHIVSRRALTVQSVGIDLGVTTPMLTGGVVPVIIRPVVPHGAQPLGGLQPVTIQLWVETNAASEGGVRQVTAVQEVEVRQDADELRPAVYLQEGIELIAGQRLVLRAVDARTGRDMGRLDLEMLVNWD